MNLSFPKLSDERYNVAIRDRVFAYANGERVVIHSRTSLYAVIERRSFLSFLPAARSSSWYIEVELVGSEAEDELLVNTALQEAAERFEAEVAHRAQVRAAGASKQRILAQASRSR